MKEGRSGQSKNGELEERREEEGHLAPGIIETFLVEPVAYH